MPASIFQTRQNVDRLIITRRESRARSADGTTDTVRCSVAAAVQNGATRTASHVPGPELGAGSTWTWKLGQICLNKTCYRCRVYLDLEVRSNLLKQNLLAGAGSTWT